MDAFSTAEVPDGSVQTKTLQNNTNLLFGGELAASEALDILNKLPGLFTPGFSLPRESFICCTIGLLLSLNLLFL
jgi:hypothetical protein